MNDTIKKYNCTCDSCEKEMRRKPYELKSGKKLFCSKECSDKYKSNINYKEMCKRVGSDFKEWLNQKYNIEKLNSRDLAELAYGKRKNGPNITNWMKRLDVPIRKRSDAIALQWVNDDERKKNAAEKAIESMGAESLGRKKLIELMQTDEYKIKISIANGGENNGMYGVFGSNHPQWNPNLEPYEREKKRHYTENRFWRINTFERDNYTCQVCGDSSGGNLVAHHLNGYHWDKENRFNLENSATLCESCHKDFHSEYGYKFNTKEQFNEYLNKALVN